MDNEILWQVSVCDNKYTVRFHKAGHLSFLRNGADWEVANQDFKHVGLILALAQELHSLKTISTATKQALSEDTMRGTYLGSIMVLLQSKGLCGEIHGEKPDQVACILPLNHLGNHGWEEENTSFEKDILR